MHRPVCLLCEDEMLISLDVEACLEAAGMEVAGPFADTTSAMGWVKSNKPDVAVIDYKLRDGECLPLIVALKRQNVPIVIHSGWSPDEGDMPEEVIGLPWLLKPMDSGLLLKMMSQIAPHAVRSEETDEATGTTL